MVVHANQYLSQNRGIFHFHRRVPKDLMHHYERSKIVFSGNLSGLLFSEDALGDPSGGLGSSSVGSGILGGEF